MCSGSIVVVGVGVGVVVIWGMVDGFHSVRGVVVVLVGLVGLVVLGVLGVLVVLVVLVVVVETGSAAIDVSFAEGVLVVMHPHL